MIIENYKKSKSNIKMSIRWKESKKYNIKK